MSDKIIFVKNQSLLVTWHSTNFVEFVGAKYNRIFQELHYNKNDPKRKNKHYHNIPSFSYQLSIFGSLKYEGQPIGDNYHASRRSDDIYNNHF